MHDPHEISRALRLAGKFLRELELGSSNRLSADLQRQVPYLLRHYPADGAIALYAPLLSWSCRNKTEQQPKDHDGSGGKDSL